jgi:hypothetical protein
MNVASERRNLTQPADWWQAFEQAANGQGVPLSVWVGRQCLLSLPTQIRHRLSDRPHVGRPREDGEDA